MTWGYFCAISKIPLTKLLCFQMIVDNDYRMYKKIILFIMEIKKEEMFYLQILCILLVSSRSFKTNTMYVYAIKISFQMFMTLCWNISLYRINNPEWLPLSWKPLIYYSILKNKLYILQLSCLCYLLKKMRSWVHF